MFSEECIFARSSPSFLGLLLFCFGAGLILFDFVLMGHGQHHVQHLFTPLLRLLPPCPRACVSMIYLYHHGPSRCFSSRLLQTTQLQNEVRAKVEMLVGSSLRAFGDGGAPAARGREDRGKAMLDAVRGADIVVATAGAFEHCMCKVSPVGDLI